MRRLDPLQTPIRQAVARIGVPAATGMLFQTLFNVTDTWFAGLISTEALAALAVSFPIFFIIIAVMVGLGSGSQALIAIAAGGGDRQRAVRLFGQAVISAGVLGLAVGLYGWFLADPLIMLIGAEGAVLAEARHYLRPILLAAPLFFLNAVTNAVLGAQGDTASYRNALIVGAVANCALNPLFIYGVGPLPGSGVTGIALATIVVQAGQLVYLVRRCRQSALGRRLTAACLRPNPQIWLALAAQAGPTTLTLASTGVGLFVITYFMGRHGEAAVAAYGIALRIEQMAMLPMIGLTTATLTLTGQNFGAARLDRVRETAHWAHLFGLAIMAVGTLVVLPARYPLMAIFADDPEVVRLGAAYLAIAALIFPAYALLAIGTSVLQGLRQPIPPMIIGIVRHVIGPLSLLTLFDVILGLGLGGIYVGVFAVAWLGAIATSVLVLRRVPRAAA